MVGAGLVWNIHKVYILVLLNHLCKSLLDKVDSALLSLLAAGVEVAALTIDGIEEDDRHIGITLAHSLDKWANACANLLIWNVG